MPPFAILNQHSTFINVGTVILLHLLYYIEKYTPMGPLILCGGFNARCGDVQAGEEVTTSCSVDPVTNHQGAREALNDLVRSTGLCIVNGTKGKDAFTCVSSRGSSVVDYCIVPCENLSMIEEFRVVTMAEMKH